MIDSFVLLLTAIFAVVGLYIGAKYTFWYLICWPVLVISLCSIVWVIASQLEPVKYEYVGLYHISVSHGRQTIIWSDSKRERTWNNVSVIPQEDIQYTDVVAQFGKPFKNPQNIKIKIDKMSNGPYLGLYRIIKNPYVFIPVEKGKFWWE